MFKEIWQALTGSRLGKIGLFMLSLMIFASFYVFITYPSNYGNEYWNNPPNWADNPKAVPPAWTSLFDSSKAKHKDFVIESPTETNVYEWGTILRYELPFDRNVKNNPTFISVSVQDVSFANLAPTMEVYLSDGEREEFLWQHTFNTNLQKGSQNIQLYTNEPFRKNITSESEVKEKVGDFFEVLRANNQSEFKVIVEIQIEQETDSIGSIKTVIGGDVFGILGTDSTGRDIWQGILYGIPFALIISVVASFIAVFIGTLLGALSGYFGGFVDTIIQRFVDLVVNIPMLPILVVLTFILLEVKLMYIVLFMGLLGWTGLAIKLKPLVVIDKEDGFVQYLRSQGFSNMRILGNVIRTALPYILAYFILFLPLALNIEAGLSFLGLGDPSIPTWGQMLNQAFITGAHTLWYWWWVIPPGFAIVYTALTFILLYFAIEPLAEPRMKRR